MPRQPRASSSVSLCAFTCPRLVTPPTPEQGLFGFVFKRQSAPLQVLLFPYKLTFFFPLPVCPKLTGLIPTPSGNVPSFLVVWRRLVSCCCCFFFFFFEWQLEKYFLPFPSATKHEIELSGR